MAQNIKTPKMADLTKLMNPTSDDEYLPELETTNTQDHDIYLDLSTNFDKIKTHFPLARIKKIMQSDEDIGKVAQATPIIVGRALECFMINLLQVSIGEARKSGVKRISASHIKQAVESTENFDFLMDAVEKYQKGP